MHINTYSLAAATIKLNEEGGWRAVESGELAVISIRDRTMVEPLWPEHPLVLQLRFDDVEPACAEDVPIWVEAGKLPFDREMLAQLDAFLAHITDKRCLQELMVHCRVGQRRSGAAALYAGSRLGVSRSRIYGDNPHIDPNRWMLSLMQLPSWQPESLSGATDAADVASSACSRRPWWQALWSFLRD